MLALAAKKRTWILDDDPDSRTSLALLAGHVGMSAKPVASAPLSADAFVKAVKADDGMVITDLRLSESWPGLSFDGAEIASLCYRQGIPAVLVSHFAEVDSDSVIRPHRRNIPSVVPADEIDGTVLSGALKLCRDEISGTFARSRRPWRALVRVEEVGRTIGDTTLVGVVVPEWHPHELVRLPISMMPAELRAKVTPGMRCFASVNTDAESRAELFFDEWEP